MAGAEVNAQAAGPDGLAARWIEAVQRLGGTDAAPAADELIAAYDRDRHYHDLAHVQQVVHHVEWLATALGLDARTTARLQLAALAHDVVYDGAPGTDEARSAAWVRDRLTACGVAPDDVARVAGLVAATAHHVAEDDAAAVLMDADLAILGSSAGTYARYVRAVRREYAHVDDQRWRAGRARVLRTLLERDPLYATGPARDRWEGQARRNMRRELADLAQ